MGEQALDVMNATNPNQTTADNSTKILDTIKEMLIVNKDTNNTLKSQENSAILF